MTARFHTQIAVSREFNRHRADSIAEESTRYCNYSKDKYGNEIKVVRPVWIDDEELSKIGPYKEVIRKSNPSATEIWVTAMLNAERDYLKLLKMGWSAQQARVVLPLNTATTLVHTAFVSDWNHFFDLRSRGTTGKPHPDAQFLAVQLEQMFKEKGYIK